MVDPRSWDAWADHYRARGYRVLTPAYPGLEIGVEELRSDPSPVEALTYARIVEHLDRCSRRSTGRRC